MQLTTLTLSDHDTDRERDGCVCHLPCTRIPWRTEDSQVHKLVKSLKRESFNGHADIWYDGVSYRVASHDSAPAFALFAQWAAKLQCLSSGAAILVPVPSSDCVSYETSTTPFRMAQAIAEQVRGVSVKPWLRFINAMRKSHQHGTRSTSILESNLEVASQAVPANVILIDDVKTTGAHLRACAAVLRRERIQVAMAVVAAVAANVQHVDPFQVMPEDLEKSPDTRDLFE